MRSLKYVVSAIACLFSMAAMAAETIVDENFNDTGTIPSGWSEIINNMSTTYSEGGGQLTMTNGTFNCTSPTTCFTISVLGNDTAFDPTASTGYTYTMNTNLVSYNDGPFPIQQNITAIGNPLNRIGWGIEEDGDIVIASAYETGGVGSGSGQAFGSINLTQVPNYSGGAIGVTMILDDNGFQVTTNTGYDSGFMNYSVLGSGFDLTKLPTNSLGVIGLIGENSVVEFDGFELFKATLTDVFDVAPGTYELIDNNETIVNTDLIVALDATVEQFSGSEVTVLDTLSLDSNTTYVVHGGTLDATNIIVDPTATLIINGGVVSADYVTGNVVHNGGVWSPGNSPGISNIDGDLDQASQSELLIELAGLNVGNEYDQINVTGTATLGGKLDIDLLYGYTPQIGDSFDILTANILVGTFDQLLLPSVAGMSWQLDYLVDEIGLTDVVRLTAIAPVPIPGAVWLFGSAIGVLGWWRRRTVVN